MATWAGRVGEARAQASPLEQDRMMMRLRCRGRLPSQRHRQPGPLLVMGSRCPTVPASHIPRALSW
jgi:hypothetical protein